MVMAMRVLLLGIVAVVSAFGQPGFGRFSLPVQIREYLELTETQSVRISEQIGAFSQWSRQRSQRMYEVQFEIAGETARSPLDPGALGVRYAEVEAIRREIVERSKKLVADNVALLTPAQTIKLKALEEALKLISTGYEARSIGLLADDCATGSYASFLLVSPLIQQIPYPNPFFGSSCAPVAMMRLGDFAAAVP